MKKKSARDTIDPKEEMIATKMNTQQKERPDAAHALLDVFVGKWNTEGETQAPALKIKGTDTYEWLEGGYFLVHYVDVHVGGEATKAIEIIGYDASQNIYTTHSYDSQGNSGRYKLSVHKHIWKIKGESERATIVFNEDLDTMMVQWEQLPDGSDWIPWMDIKLTKEK